jgi:hypothetical protein
MDILVSGLTVVLLVVDRDGLDRHGRGDVAPAGRPRADPDQA